MILWSGRGSARTGLMDLGSTAVLNVMGMQSRIKDGFVLLVMHLSHTLEMSVGDRYHISRTIGAFLTPRFDIRFTHREVRHDESDGTSTWLPGSNGQWRIGPLFRQPKRHSLCGEVSHPSHKIRTRSQTYSCQCGLPMTKYYDEEMGTGRYCCWACVQTNGQCHDRFCTTFM